MSLKAELETWAAALKAYDEGDFDKSLTLFFVRHTDMLSLMFPINICPSADCRFIENSHQYWFDLRNCRRARSSS